MRQTSAGFTRRSLFASTTLAPLALAEDEVPFEVDAGIDRIVVLPANQPGITWLHRRSWTA